LIPFKDLVSHSSRSFQYYHNGEKSSRSVHFTVPGWI